MTHEQVAQWLAAYSKAWESYDPQAIGDLFSADAAYYYHPYDEPTRGREAIVASWLENRDPEGRYKGEYRPFAVEGNRAAAQGESRYFAEDGKTLEREYHNLFLLTFDDKGRCSEFREWYAKSQGQQV
jgi:nuclear transport factor 2 (NTF2) superfamily protein